MDISQFLLYYDNKKLGFELYKTLNYLFIPSLKFEIRQTTVNQITNFFAKSCLS